MGIPGDLPSESFIFVWWKEDKMNFLKEHKLYSQVFDLLVLSFPENSHLPKPSHGCQGCSNYNLKEESKSIETIAISSFVSFFLSNPENITYCNFIWVPGTFLKMQEENMKIICGFPTFSDTYVNFFSLIISKHKSF